METMGSPEAGTKNSSASSRYALLLVGLVLASVGGGYLAGTQPKDAGWRFFSWHPLLMSTGMIGLAGIGAITKKLGGYTNTKYHGILGWLSIFVSLTGIYCIYRNKENNGYSHLQSTHSWCGAGVVISSVGIGLAGGIFLHPDFGVDKTNKLIRKAHKWASRATLAFAWVTAVGGLLQLTTDPLVLALYALPLVSLVPFTLI